MASPTHVVACVLLHDGDSMSIEEHVNADVRSNCISDELGNCNKVVEARLIRKFPTEVQTFHRVILLPARLKVNVVALVG